MSPSPLPIGPPWVAKTPHELMPGGVWGDSDFGDSSPSSSLLPRAWSAGRVGCGGAEGADLGARSWQRSWPARPRGAWRAARSAPALIVFPGAGRQVGTHVPIAPSPARAAYRRDLVPRPALSSPLIPPCLARGWILFLPSRGAREVARGQGAPGRARRALSAAGSGARLPGTAVPSAPGWALPSPGPSPGMGRG